MNDNCTTCRFMSKAAETLNQEHLGFLSCNKAMVQFTKGDSIIKQGMFSTNLFFLPNPFLKIHSAAPYHEQIVRLVKAPTYLGLPTTFGDKINQYSVTAVTDAEVCYIDVKVFLNILSENREFSNEIIIELCQNELESFRRCANRTQKQLRGNMAEALLEFSEKIFKNDSFILPISQSELANLVDTSRESVSRVLNEFNDDGLIAINAKQITILNKKSLLLISQNG